MAKSQNPQFPHMESYLIHGPNSTPSWDYSHHINPPITESVAFRLESTERGAQGFIEFANQDNIPDNPIYIYERLDEPSVGMLEDRLATAERGESALVFATGMAAISATICTLLKNGDHIISHDSVYGCTYALLTTQLWRQGIDVTMVNMLTNTDWPKLIKPNTRVIYFETPINPTLEILDIEAISKIAADINKSRKEEDRIYVVVDNTFASPYCQRPLELGADVVVASLTKHIGGFGATMGGMVVAPKKLHNKIKIYRKDFGGVIHGKSAWPILIYGLPTLSTRLRAQIETTKKLTAFLEKHPKIAKVNYPGLESFKYYKLAQKQMRSFNGEFAPGAVFLFVLKGTPNEAKEKGSKLINWLAKNSLTYTLAVSLGCVKTLIEHPSSMTHSAIPPEEQIKAGIEPGGIRIAVGLEEPEALIEELSKGLDQI